jgi:TolA-binding protein
MKRLISCLVIFSAIAATAVAQDFEIKKYDLNARVNAEEESVAVTAKLNLVNLTDPNLGDKMLLSNEKPRMSFYLNSKAKVEKMSINGVAAAVKTSEDTRNNLLRVSAEMSLALITTKTLDVELSYSIPSTDRSGSLHISRGEIYLLPGSFWVPVVHTPYVEHGADTAPFSLTVAAPPGMKVVSSGVRKSETSFEESMASQPFLIVGDYEVTARGGESHPVEVYAPRGLGEIGKQQAQRIAAEAERMLAFFVKTFGVPAMAPFRIVATQARQLNTATSETFSQSKEIAFASVNTITIDDNIFRRDVVDLGAIELIASAAARSWVDGQVLLRGRGSAMLRDALPIYYTAQYLGDRYGQAQLDAAFDRYRRAYNSIARNDSPLLMQNPLDRNYTTSVYNKGAMVWRMIEKQLGRTTLENALKASLSRMRVDVLSLNEWRSPLCNLSRCANFKNNLIAAGGDRKLVNELFANWIDDVKLPDFAVGQPQTTAAGVESTVANFGTGDFTVDIVGVKENGEKIKQSVTVAAGQFGSAVFPAGAAIKRVEADPDKLYLQSDYTNDIYPRLASQSEAFGQANLAFSKNDFAVAEAKAREGLQEAPNTPTLQSLLGRALLAQKKNDEAGKIFAAVLKAEPLPIQAYGLTHLGLGEIALAQNNAAEAARHYRFAAAADLDAGTSILARDGAQKAERAANAIKIPEDIRAFLQKFDASILQGQTTGVNQFIEMGNLRKFAQNLVVRKPSIWVTETLRAEDWDANRTAVDVALKIKIEGKDYSGRALYVLSRAGGKLLLSEVPIFDVK